MGPLFKKSKKVPFSFITYSIFKVLKYNVFLFLPWCVFQLAILNFPIKKNEIFKSISLHFTIYIYCVLQVWKANNFTKKAFNLYTESSDLYSSYFVVCTYIFCSYQNSRNTHITNSTVFTISWYTYSLSTLNTDGFPICKEGLKQTWVTWSFPSMSSFSA